MDGMVQLKLAGDVYNGAYAPGNTLRNGGSVTSFIIKARRWWRKRIP